MSEKVRRQKDIIDSDTTSLKSATKQYSDYFNGEAPIYITYYQIADAASKVDSALDDTAEVVGTNSSLKYYRIKNIPVYGLNVLDINNQLSQRGLESSISGDFVMTPVLNIHPRGGNEFFVINDSTAPDLAQHLFVITDVQYDRATSDKFYKCSFKLYPKDADLIYSQVIKNFVYEPNGSGNTDGVGDSVLISEEAAQSKEKIAAMIDGLIDTYTELFYNDGMDTFVYQKPLDSTGTSFEYYWCPYVCHFIYKNDLMKKSSGEFLQEIFCQDINESSFPSIYSERGYRKSLFYATEVQDATVMNALESSFFEISPYDLNMPLNLPFFSSGETYKLIDVYHKDNTAVFWSSAFHLVYSDEDNPYVFSGRQYRFSGSIVTYFDNLPKDATTGELKPEAIISGDSLFYRVDSGETYPSDVYYLSTEGTVSDAKISSMITNGTSTITDDELLFDIIRCYIKGTLSVTDSVLSEINSHYYEPSIKTYILLPIAIYALKSI